MIGLVTAGLATMALSGAAYAAMAPGSQLFGRTVTSLTDPRQIALTYDDGPSDPHTLELLDVLAKHGVRATFFVIGRNAALRPDIVEAVAQAGHVIGNHTYTHRNLMFASRPRVRREIEACERQLTEVVGKSSQLFRLPYGARRPDVLHTVRAMNLLPVMWNVTCFDWRLTSAEAVERVAVRQVARHRGRVGNIILLHDGGDHAIGADRSHTVQATDRLIRRYKAQGYQFVTLAQSR